MKNILEYDDLETMFDMLETSMEGYNLRNQIQDVVDYQLNKTLMQQLNWNEKDHLYLQLFCNMYQYLIQENAISKFHEENDLDIVTTLISAFIPNFFAALNNEEIKFVNFEIKFIND